jgi:predicted ATP-dependent protease
VTGSVDQNGRVQPIGGATAKIEGFFEVCRQRGLDGSHGVMIPRANLEHVVLRPEVAEAVEQGRFHVWAVSTIEEGIELLTGMRAGDRGEDGHFEEGTLYRRVEDRLDDFARQLRAFPTQPSGDGLAPHLVAPAAPPPQPPGIPPQPPPDPPVIV